jgi:NAD(P)-dependent dehydrogenase (short-subunit alcohol dehydrogenase family)
MTDPAPLGRLLEGRVAVVTGGSRGIGAGIATALAAAGARVVISGRRADVLEQTAQAIGATPVVADATDRRAAIEPVRVAVEQQGRIDVLVNNVGGSTGANPSLFAGDLDDEDGFEADLRLNLTAAYWPTRAAVRSMRKQGFGRVINIGSGASFRAAASPAYTAAKHGLVGLTRQLAVDLARHGITVNCICPGWTETDLVDFEALARHAGVTPEQARANAEAESAQRRILAPAELGPICVLLASPSGGAITGQVIPVDGGYRL